MFPLIEKKGIIPPANWEVIIDSSIVGCAKPNMGIYTFAENKSRTKGKEILFIDNTKNNLEPAKKLGWKTFYYDSSHPEKSSNDLLLYIESLESNN
jgi:FMN phosphatase YigB (HAD superfamily)